MSNAIEYEEKQALLNPTDDDDISKYSTEKKLDVQRKLNRFTPGEVINYLGFGKAQIIACLILSVANIGGYSAMQLQPYLSARLYVDMQLSPYSEALLGFVSLAGSMFSSLPVGFISDKIGRRKTNILVCFLITFWDLLSCAAPNFAWVVFCRLMAAFSRGTVNTSSVYFREFFPSDKLWIGPFAGQQIAGTVLGEFFAITAAYFLLTDENISWRYYVIIISSPMLLAVLLVTLFLNETPEYLLSKGRQAEAVKVVERIAKLNGKELPENFKLEFREKEVETDVEDNDDEFDQKSYWKMFLSVMKIWTILKVFVLIIVIGAAAKFITDGMSYILTDLLFLEGQSGDYCCGTELKTYYISKSDYLKLMGVQLASVVTVFVSFPVLKLKVSLKYQSLLCFSLAVVFVSALYLCPDIYVVFSILSVLRVLMQVINISSTLALIQLQVPVRVRGLIVGLGQVLRNVFLPINTFFNQCLSKKSQHYVTSLTLFVVVLALISAVIIPKDINEGVDKKDKNDEKK